MNKKKTTGCCAATSSADADIYDGCDIHRYRSTTSLHYTNVRDGHDSTWHNSTTSCSDADTAPARRVTLTDNLNSTCDRSWWLHPDGQCPQPLVAGTTSSARVQQRCSTVP
eukprot:m.391188 g.391188  ORF g.391188 m.391188 type:complete len:111 (+) comp21073_c0_seq2:296-628(+)